jgi:hypothetical protein
MLKTSRCVGGRNPQAQHPKLTSLGGAGSPAAAETISLRVSVDKSR